MKPSRKSFSLFLFVWAGQLLSKLGGGISAFALGLHLLQTTGSTSAYSFLLMAAFLPAVLLAPVGGVIADRKDRMLAMAAGDLGSSLGVLLILVLFWAHPNPFGTISPMYLIYLGASVSSAFAALQSPAFKAAVTDLLDEAEYAKASGLIQLAEASQYLLGPILAAFLLSRFSLSLVLAIDMATFVGAALCALLVRNRLRPGMENRRMENPATENRMKEERTPVRFREALADGVRYIGENPTVRHLLALATAVTFLVGILQTLFVPMVLSLSNSRTAGIVQSISASGMLAGSLWIGLSGKPRNQRRILASSLFAAGIFYILVGASPSAAWITCAAFGFFFTLPFANASLEVLFRRNIDNEMQGRAWSLISLVSQAGGVAAFGVAGLLADHLFNPLLTGTGLLADTVGRAIGTGASRGSGLMVMVCGALLLPWAFFSAKSGRKQPASSDWATQAE